MVTFIVRQVILIFVVANPNLRVSHRKQVLSFARIALVSTPAQLKESSPIVNSDHNGLSLRRLLPDSTKPTAKPVWR